MTDAHQFQITQLTSDLEISTRIIYQYNELKDAMFPDKPDNDQVLKILLDVVRKLECVLYHKNNILRLGTDLSSQSQKDLVKDNPTCVVVDHTSGIDKEFEAFLMQGKSCLDILVKLLQPFFGPYLHTFGEGGVDVINALENNLKKTDKARVGALVEMIREDQEWIKKWFTDERTSITHYKSLVNSGVAHLPVRGESPRTIVLPRTKEGQCICSIAPILYQNLLTFCADFMALAMQCKFPPTLSLRILSEAEVDPKTPRKFGLGMDTVQKAS